jgi:hypothetical protein
MTMRTGWGVVTSRTRPDSPRQITLTAKGPAMAVHQHTTKFCRMCGLIKPVEAFGFEHRSTRRYHRCRRCCSDHVYNRTLKRRVAEYESKKIGSPDELRPGDTWMVNGLDWSWAFVIFREVPGFPGYCVGSNGTFWSRMTRRWDGFSYQFRPFWTLVAGTDNGGYVSVRFSERPNVVRDKMLHRVILETFIGTSSPEMDSCHRNGDRSDNRLANLRWDTRRGNMADAVEHGRTNQGEKNPFAKLTADQVREIRAMIGTMSQSRIAEMFGVCQQTISNIHRKTWKHIT